MAQPARALLPVLIPRRCHTPEQGALKKGKEKKSIRLCHSQHVHHEEGVRGVLAPGGVGCCSHLGLHGTGAPHHTNREGAATMGGRGPIINRLVRRVDALMLRPCECRCAAARRRAHLVCSGAVADLPVLSVEPLVD